MLSHIPRENNGAAFGSIDLLFNTSALTSDIYTYAKATGVFRALSPSHAQGRGNPFLDHPRSAMKVRCES